MVVGGVTCVGQSVAVGSCGGRSVVSFDFEGVGRLFFTIKHHFGEDLAGLLVDFKVVLALVSGRVHDPVVNLIR